MRNSKSHFYSQRAIEASAAAYCDASVLLQNAVDVGDCSTVLASRKSCRNIGIPGYFCTLSTCVDGNFTAGVCSQPSGLAARSM